MCILLVCSSGSLCQTFNGTQNPTIPKTVHVVHVLGFEGASRKAKGDITPRYFNKSDGTDEEKPFTQEKKGKLTNGYSAIYHALSS
jgi:hypothetical protein